MFVRHKSARLSIKTSVVPPPLHLSHHSALYLVASTLIRMFPVVINQIDQMPVYDMHSFSDACLLCAASSLAPNSGAVSEPATSSLCFPSALVSSLLGTTAYISHRFASQIYVGAHPLACGCSYEWRQPVRADGPDDVLTAINMANNC